MRLLNVPVANHNADYAVKLVIIMVLPFSQLLPPNLMLLSLNLISWRNDIIQRGLLESQETWILFFVILYTYCVCDQGKLSKYLSLSTVSVETIMIAVWAIKHNSKRFPSLSNIQLPKSEGRYTCGDHTEQITVLIMREAQIILWGFQWWSSHIPYC